MPGYDFCIKFDVWNAQCIVPCWRSTATDNLKGSVWAGVGRFWVRISLPYFWNLIWLPMGNWHLVSSDPLLKSWPGSLLKENLRAALGWTCSLWGARWCSLATNCWHQKARMCVWSNPWVCVVCAELQPGLKISSNSIRRGNTLLPPSGIVITCEIPRATCGVHSWCNSKQHSSNKASTTSGNDSYAKTGMRTYHCASLLKQNKWCYRTQFFKEAPKKLFPWTCWYELACFLAQETTNSYCGKLLTPVK